MRVLSRLFRRLFLQMLAAAHKANALAFLGDRAALAETLAFIAFLALLRKAEWVMRRSRLAVRKPCSPICRATPIASPFPSPADLSR